MVKAHNNGEPSSSSSKLDRKTIEKNRRIHMKSLCSKLFNLVPPSHFKISKDLLTQQHQISHVIAYITELKERVENLEKKKQALQLQTHSRHKHYLDVPAMMTTTTTTTTISDNYMLPIVELRDLGNHINIMLISSIDRSVMLYQIINVVEEEGGHVVNASLSRLGNKIFYSLHIEAKILRVGIETSRVHKRLQNLINN